MVGNSGLVSYAAFNDGANIGSPVGNSDWRMLACATILLASPCACMGSRLCVMLLG